MFYRCLVATNVGCLMYSAAYYRMHTDSVLVHTRETLVHFRREILCYVDVFFSKCKPCCVACFVCLAKLGCLGSCLCCYVYDIGSELQYLLPS